MKAFSFHLPTRIEVGNDLLLSTATLVRATVPGERILLVTDPGIERAGLARQIREVLQADRYHVLSFNQIDANPKDVDCERGAAVAEDFGADIIVALGGGSVMDAAKAIAVLNTHGGRARDWEGRGKLHREVLPIVAIPTTAGTGSEVTRSSVITDTQRHVKMTIKDLRLAPRLAIVDPRTTGALPAGLTASTGMDALVHAIESYTCKLANPISDALALAAMSYLYPNLREAVHNGQHEEARDGMMVGSLLAGMAFSHADVAAVHCMAEAIGGLYDTPHGVANAMFLPFVTAFNASADLPRHASVARACGIVDRDMPDDAATACLVQALKDLARDIHIPSFSASPRVNPADFPALAEASFRNGSTPSNARPILQEDYLRLFEQAYAA